MQILVVTRKSQRATSAVTPLRAQGGNPQEVSEVKTNLGAFPEFWCSYEAMKNNNQTNKRESHHKRGFGPFLSHQPPASAGQTQVHAHPHAAGQERRPLALFAMQEPGSLQTLAVDSAASQAPPDHQYEIAFILL